MGLIILFLIAINFWINKVEEESNVPVTSNRPTALPAPEKNSALTPTPNVVVPQQQVPSNDKNLSENKKSVSEQGQRDHTSNEPHAVSQTHSTLQQAESMPQSSSSAPVNSLPTQEQIMARIILQNQKDLELNNALSNRIDEINKVHQAILDSGGKSHSSEVKPFVEPLLTPPDDVIEKIKSHHWTAH